MSFIAKLGGSENCFIIPPQTPSPLFLSHSLLAPLPPFVALRSALNLSRGTGCPVKQHRWRNAEPPRDLKHRLSIHNSHTPRHDTTRSQCVKSRHSMKYDSSSNLVSHFHHRPPSRVVPRVPSRHRPGEARPQSISLSRTLTHILVGIRHTSSGTSGSAIKVACTPISSPISDKCLGFGHHWSIRSAQSRRHLAHSLTLGTLGPDERP